jgi:TPR repeat protein
MRSFAAILLALACILSVCSEPAQAEERIALLIGNQGYNANVGPLKNPHSDIAIVGAALRRLGFKVTEKADADYRTMSALIKQHIQNVRREGQGAISFVYYSGHGAAAADTKLNYLIPVDVTNADDEELWNYSIDLNGVIEGLRREAPKATHYVVFDACRNELNLTRRGKKGLADKGFEPIPHVPGVMVAYATAPGQTATDAGSGGGVYARLLAEEIVRPGVEAMSMFRQVARRVQREIGQDPWMSATSTLPEIYFAREPIPSTPPLEAQKSAARAPELECDRLAAHPDDPEAVVNGVDFEQIKALRAIGACERARRQFPDENRFSYQLARAYTAARNHARAKELLEGLVGYGYPAAFYSLGLAYAEGQGVREDRAVAFDFVRKSAERGFGPAMVTLGEELLKSADARDRTEGVAWIERAAVAGHGHAMYALGDLYQRGDGVAQDDAKAVHWFEKGARNGNAEAMEAFGEALRRGFGIAKDETKAASWLRQAANSGRPTAMAALGQMYSKGNGLPKDESEARRLFREAAEIAIERGETAAVCNLAVAFQQGEVVTKDLVQAAHWFTKAAEGGCIYSKLNLGIMHANGRGVAKDSAKSMEWFRKAMDGLQKSAEKGNTNSMSMLAEMHRQGLGGPKSDEEAFRWMLKTAEAGDPEGMHRLAEYHNRGIGVAKNPMESVRWILKSAEKGHTDAMRSLAYRYLEGQGVSKDAKVGMDWLRKAAEKRDTLAMVELGELHETGRYMAKDEAEAAQWYRRSIENGSNDAIPALARMYLEGRGVPKSEDEGIRLLRKGAQAKIPLAMLEMGRQYTTGIAVPKDESEGRRLYREAVEIAIENGETAPICQLALSFSAGEVVTKDLVQAARWFTKAAEGGCTYSMLSLGIMHANGRGVPKDNAKATEWFRRAAEGGNASAMEQLGIAYYYGRGVRRSYLDAFNWFRKAADLGDGSGMIWLGELYELGQGVVKDESEAAAWYRKAMEAGYSPAIPFLGRLHAEGRGVEKSEA